MMRTGPIDRRRFLKSAGVGFLASLAPRGVEALAGSDALFATAFQKRSGEFGVALIGETGALAAIVPLPARGHDVTADPQRGMAVAFARRPGTFMVAFDLAGHQEPSLIASPAGRHFFGHGVFSPDGRLLYATENDFDAAEGRVGVYNASAGFRRIGEFATHGMDPHEMLLMPDGRTLAIANGGIETHPDYGRAKLNLATMKPSLAFVDRETGALLEKHELEPDLHQLSIRHMALDGAGALWFGCQYEGSQQDAPPLVARVRKGEAVALVSLPDDVLAGLRNYVGSVTANTAQGTIAVSSPQGNRMAVLDAQTGTVIASRRLAEVCGLAPNQSGYLASTGTGVLADSSGPETTLPDFVWDNHLLRIDL